MKRRPQSSDGGHRQLDTNEVTSHRRRPFDLNEETRTFTSLAGKVFRATGVHPMSAGGKRASAPTNSFVARSEDDDEFLSATVARHENKRLLDVAENKHLAYLLQSPACAHAEALKYFPGEEVLDPETGVLLDSMERVRSIVARFSVSDSARRMLCADVEKWVQEAALLGQAEVDDALSGERKPWVVRAEALQMEDKMLVDSGAVANEISKASENITTSINELQNFGERLFSDLRCDQESRQWQSELKQRNMKSQASLTDVVVDCSIAVSAGDVSPRQAGKDPSVSPASRRAAFPPPGHFPLPKELFVHRAQGERLDSPRRAASGTDGSSSNEPRGASPTRDESSNNAFARRQLAAAAHNHEVIVNTFRSQLQKRTEVVQRFRESRRREKRKLMETLEAMGVDMPWELPESMPLDAKSETLGAQLPIRDFFNEASAGANEEAEREGKQLSDVPPSTFDDDPDFLVSAIQSVVDFARAKEKRNTEIALQQRDAQITALQHQVLSLQHQSSINGARGVLIMDPASAVKDVVISSQATDNSRKLHSVFAERDAAVALHQASQEEIAQLRALVGVLEVEKRKKTAQLSVVEKESSSVEMGKEMALADLREKERQMTAFRVGLMRHAQQLVAAKDAEIAVAEKESSDLRAQIQEMEEEEKLRDAKRDKDIDALERINESLTRDMNAALGCIASTVTDITLSIDNVSRADVKTNMTEAALNSCESVAGRCCAFVRQVRDLPSLSGSAFSRAYSRIHECCQHADSRHAAAKDAVDRIRGGQGSSGIIAELRAQLEAALTREQQLTALHQQTLQKHEGQLADEEALREDIVGVLRSLQNAIGSATRAPGIDQLRVCDLTLGRDGKGDRRASTLMLSKPEAGSHLAKVEEMAIAAFAAVKHRLWKLIQNKAPETEPVLDAAPLAFSQPLSERTSRVRQLALDASGLQDQLRLMRVMSMTFKCLIQPTQALIAAASSPHASADVQTLLAVMGQFEEILRESANTVLSSLFWMFRFEQSWTKLSQQATLLSKQCAVVADRILFLFNRTEDLDNRREVIKRQAAYRASRDKLVAILEGKFQLLAVTYQQSTRDANKVFHDRIDNGVRILKGAERYLLSLFESATQWKKEKIIAQQDLVKLQFRSLEETCQEIRKSIEQGAREALSLIVPLKQSSYDSVVAVESLTAELSHLELRTKRSIKVSADIETQTEQSPSCNAGTCTSSDMRLGESLLIDQETMTELLEPSTLQSVVNMCEAECRPRQFSDAATSTDPRSPLTSVDAEANASTSVAEVCCQTDFIDGSSKIISTAAPAVVIPAAQLRSDSPDVGPSLASSQTPASPKNELTRKIEMALLAASVNSSVSKSDVAHENRAVQTDSSATAALVNVPPAATPLKFARQRRQVLQLTLVQDQPVSKTPPSFAVQGEPCPRQAPHHGPNQAAYSLVTVGLQTDAQLLYDYIAVVSKMMLRSGAPCPEAPPSVAPTIVQTTAPGQQGSEASVLKNAGQAQEEPHPWQSFFKNRRPVSATKR